jgi:hypothetical protein
MTKCELCLRLLLGRSPLRIALSWEANYAASMMQKCLLTVSCCVLVPFYLSATCLYGSCALKRLFSPIKVTFVIWWILGVAAEWVDEET